MFCAESVARTSNVCDPTPRPLYALGEAHDDQAEPSSLHSNVEPASLAENEKLAFELEIVPLGPASIWV